MIDHIAAGEVVERPASVAKELVENALDAGATSVSVDLRDGGMEHLSVTDNGCGMHPEQARLCLMRHATSKLTCSEDLFHIATLGFRGEALSSIASVSRMRLVTRPAGAAMGYELCIEAGKIVREGVVGSPYGTQMVIDALFFNTPARRKFMRAPATEQTHVVEAVKRVILGARRGGVCVTRGPRRLLDIPDEAPPEQRVRSILGRHVGAVASFAAQAGDVRATGFVGAGQGERSDARNLWLFVNGRFVRDRHLQRAVVEAVSCKTWEAQAIVVAYIDLPPSQVDVNVHPQKLEVRFADGRDVFAALAAGVAQGVQALGGAQKVHSVQRSVHGRIGHDAGEAPPDRHIPQGGHHDSDATTTGESRAWPLGSGYLLHQVQNETVIIHAPTWVRTRATSRWHAAVRAGEARRHTLLLPEPFDGRLPWQDWLAEEHANLQAYGFDIAPVGPGRFLARAIPEALLWGRTLDVVLRFVEAAHRHHRGGPPAPGSDALRAMIVACVGALDVSDADAWVSRHLEDASWTGMRPEDGVVHVTPPVLQRLFPSA